MNEFRFNTAVKLVEITGRKAATLPELLEGIREMDASVIFHHTHHFVLQHHYLVPEPSSEFAHWIGEVLQERSLAELLQSINTVEFGTLRALRERIVEVIEGYLKSTPRINPAPPGLEFHFLRAQKFVFPTRYIAVDLPSFRDALARVSLNSIYHHMFEAKLRLERGSNDFSTWLERDLGEKALAEAIARLDPYTYTLEGLREAILDKIGTKLAA